MQEDQIKDFIPLPKQQNPLLKRRPLNLGNTFHNYVKPDNPIHLPKPLTQFQIVILLFAAESCNVSRPFMKILQKFYQQVNLQKKRLQIIYISVDKQHKQSFIYPWIGIRFDDPRVKDLKQFYNITSIPSLILLDSLGQKINHDCREDIYQMNQDQAMSKWIQIKGLRDIENQNKLANNQIPLI